jgi:agmatine/peptidylarginine deiminase
MTAPADAWRLPAEWEPQAAVLLAWPHAGTDWGDHLAEAEDGYIGIVAAITRFEPIVLCVPDDDIEAYAQARLASNRVDMRRVRFVQVAYDDTWLRDSGPITLVTGTGQAAASRPSPAARLPGHVHDESADADPASAPPGAGGSKRFTLLDFRFTGWGGKFEASRDDQLVQSLAAHTVFDPAAAVDSIPFALEGGAIDSDGDGRLLTTWQCLHSRHPALDRSALSLALAGHLAAREVLWLEHGALEGDDTDAHVDTLARFAARDAIVYQACDDPADGHFRPLAAMATELAALCTRDGTPYRLFPLPWPRPIIEDGRRLAASYANFLIVNGAVLVPAYGDPADDAAVQVLAQAFPGREIVPVPCRALIRQNGSLHCVTMQLPAGALA